MKVFISHSNKDKAAASRISEVIKSLGHDVVADPANIRAGANVFEALSAELETADAIVPLISHNLLSSAAAQKELSSLALKALSKPGVVILPVRIDDSIVPSYLANSVYLEPDRKRIE